MMRGKRLVVGIETFAISFLGLLMYQMSMVDDWYVAHALRIGQTPFGTVLSFEPGDPIPFEWAWMILVGILSLLIAVIVLSIYDAVKKSKIERIKIR